MRRLQIADEPTRACATCPAPCCQSYEVVADGHDLHRLSRGLSVPWQDLVELKEHQRPTAHGFHLDCGPRSYTLRLRRRESGACQFLLELPGGHRRCGVHGLRPAECRVYPLVASDDEPAGSFVWGMSMCPEPQKEIYRAARAALRPLVEEDLAELQLTLRALGKWNEAALRLQQGRRLQAEAYADWVLALHGAIEPLRAGERGDWQPRACAVIDGFPLPEGM